MIPLCLLRQEKGTRKGRGREEKYIIPEGNN